ncbi:MAG: hypothetical protein LBC78_03835 [Oscillospiraceae bacterium]|nr:hypothetical protein [Oscillospiraceae bacterium]
MKKALCLAFAMITAITLFGCRSGATKTTRAVTPYKDYSTILRAPSRARTLPAVTARPRATQLPRTGADAARRNRSAGPRTRTYTNAVPYNQYPANAPMVTYPGGGNVSLPARTPGPTMAPRRAITRGAAAGSGAVNPGIPGTFIG